jgi:hypothetical protein
MHVCPSRCLLYDWMKCLLQSYKGIEIATWNLASSWGFLLVYASEYHFDSESPRVILIHYAAVSLQIASFKTWTQGTRHLTSHLSVDLQVPLTCSSQHPLHSCLELLSITAHHLLFHTTVLYLRFDYIQSFVLCVTDTSVKITVLSTECNLQRNNVVRLSVSYLMLKKYPPQRNMVKVKEGFVCL